MSVILAIDPGTMQSAWLEYDPAGVVRGFGIEPNPYVLSTIAEGNRGGYFERVVIEKVASYGMPVGEEIFETVRWAGRFEQAAQPLPVHRITRKAIVTHLCGSARAKDPNVRAALIDRFGGPTAIKKGGPLYGIHGDLWAALAVAVTWSDTHGDKP